MCDCKQRIETQLLERFKEQAPEATDHSVELQGYGFAIVENKLSMRPYMPYLASSLRPLKNGGTKLKKENGSMFFSFCPFCGEKAEAAHD